MNSLLTLSFACIYYEIAEFEVVPYSQKLFRQIQIPRTVDILIWHRSPQPKWPFSSTSLEISTKSVLFHYFCYGEFLKGHHLVESLVSYWLILKNAKNRSPKSWPPKNNAPDSKLLLTIPRHQPNTTTRPTSDISSLQHGKRTRFGATSPRASVLNSVISSGNHRWFLLFLFQGLL